jgi:hypothetical protein
MSFAPFLSLFPHGLLKPAQHQQQLVVDHVGCLKREAAGSAVRIDELLKPVRRSEELPVAARHDCEIISRVADHGELSVDDAHLVRLPIPEDALWQEILMEQHGRPILRHVIPRPLGNRGGIWILRDEVEGKGAQPSQDVGAAVSLTSKDTEGINRHSMSSAGNPSYRLNDELLLA